MNFIHQKYIGGQLRAYYALIHPWVTIILSFLLAYSVILLPDFIFSDSIAVQEFIRDVKPQWVILLVIYWSIFRSEYMGLIGAWIVGLGLDILHVGLVGKYAMVCALTSYVSFQMRSFMFYYPGIMQVLIVSGLLVMAQIVIFWIQFFLMPHAYYTWAYWVSPWVTAVLWIGLRMIFDKKVIQAY